MSGALTLEGLSTEGISPARGAPAESSLVMAEFKKIVIIFNFLQHTVPIMSNIPETKCVHLGEKPESFKCTEEFSTEIW